MTSTALDAPPLAHPFLAIFFPSLAASPEAGALFEKPIRVRDFLIRSGLHPGGPSIAPAQVLKRALGTMAELFGTVPPSLEEVWDMFDRDQYLRLENFDAPVPVERYLRNIAATELRFGRKELFPNAIVELLLKRVIPPIVGCKL